MKVHVYLLCYNEAEIIESVIRYYEQFCSKIFILDNYSTDDSVKIAKKFPKVTVIQWQSGDKIDEALYVKMKSSTYKNYSREGGKYTTEVADWIISCDMDEIVYHPNIIEVLAEYKNEKVTVPKITGFNMYGENEVDPNQSIFKQYIYGSRAPQFDKRVLFDVDFDMSYTYGAHPHGTGFEYMRSTYGFASSNKHPIALLHYKHIGNRWYDKAVQNVARLKNKIIIKDGRYCGLGSHYQAIVDGAIINKKIDTRVVDDNGLVLFNNFPPTTGDVGAIPRQETMSPDEIDFLKNLAVSCENDKLKDSHNLMKIAYKGRPNDPFIKKKLNDYEDKLKSIETV